LPFVMEVSPSVPAKTVAEFIAHAKANPGKINTASFGTGTISHLAWELFKLMTGVDTVHVPYHGGAPMVTDLIGGRVEAGIDALPNSLPHIRSGTLRALAVTGPARSAAVPDVPTVGETVPGYEVSGWTGIGVPAGTPAAIVATLNREINAGLADARIAARLAEVGGRAADPRHARSIRPALAARHRQVGEGGEVRRREAGVDWKPRSPLALKADNREVARRSPHLGRGISDPRAECS